MQAEAQRQRLRRQQRERALRQRRRHQLRRNGHHADAAAAAAAVGTCKSTRRNLSYSRVRLPQRLVGLRVVHPCCAQSLMRRRHTAGSHNGKNYGTLQEALVRH